MRKFLGIFIGVLVVLCLCGCINSNKETVNEEKITLAGGTALVPIMEEAGKEFMKKHPNVKVMVSGGGSGFGIKQVGEGLVDIGDASRDAKPEELQKYPLEDHVIGMDGVAIIVNPANPIDNLNKEQVKKIFAGEITSWGQVLGQ